MGLPLPSPLGVCLARLGVPPWTSSPGGRLCLLSGEGGAMIAPCAQERWAVGWSQTRASESSFVPVVCSACSAAVSFSSSALRSTPSAGLATPCFGLKLATELKESPELGTARSSGLVASLFGLSSLWLLNLQSPLKVWQISRTLPILGVQHMRQ